LITADFWKFFAGLGVFLYGMFHLEDSLKQIEGRSFKLFLKKFTKNKLSAILSGTLVTGFLQSSSIVNLIMLSFVGAGIISMRNAFGVVIGSNIGGTFNSWLIAMLGFKINFSTITMPLLAISSICLLLLKNQKLIYNLSKFLMGFSLIFLGLDFMKESMELLIKEFNILNFLNYPLSFFVLIGFVITAIIQTSSAMVVIVLSALYSQVISIEVATSTVLGAELGTTIKLLISSIGGISAKKRLAMGNFIFNFFTSLFGFVFLSSIIKFIKIYLGIEDSIFILVSFQSIINIVAAILFYFVLNYYTGFLEKIIGNNDKTITYYLNETNNGISNTFNELIEKEIGLFICRIIQFNKAIFNIDSQIENNSLKDLEKNKLLLNMVSLTDKYALLKQAEGEVITFYTKNSVYDLNTEDSKRLNLLMASLRNAMYSAKCMKDIILDEKNLRNSANDLKYNFYNSFRDELAVFYSTINLIFVSENNQYIFSELEKLVNNIKVNYDEKIKNFYKELTSGVIKEVDISTLFNINREIYSSCKALIFSLKDYLLDAESAEKFENGSVKISIIK